MNQREAFEKWASNHYASSYFAWIDDCGCYEFEAVQLLFDAWQAAQKSQWQPIETAPRDGSPILVNWYGDASDSAVIVYWSNGWETGDSRQYEELHPDVWMQLPPEPNK